jgi:hypothetical protein
VFYFYQSSAGQPIFLHAPNVQMLVKQFGCLENCPKTILAEILEKESTIMTEELRDRLRYMRHLPVASSFEEGDEAAKDDAGADADCVQGEVRGAVIHGGEAHPALQDKGGGA